MDSGQSPETATRIAGHAVPAPQGRLPVSRILASRFQIVRFIAAGGMGEVYEAQDLQLRTRVALKVVRPDIAAQPQLAARFKREVQHAMRITHPNVCRVHDLGADPDGTLFLTMAFLPGETLAARLRRGPMTSGEAAPFIAQMAAALHAAHSAGIVHRDFKAANVMLTPGPDAVLSAVVTDFGLAHRYQREPASDSTLDLTPAGQFAGTPDYMAPEQIEGGPITPAVDIYALGVVMYEMVTGRRPYPGGDSLASLVRRLQSPPEPPTRFVPDLDPRWEAAILRCLARTPDERFASADDVPRALTGDLPATVATWAPRRTRRWVFAAAAAAGVLGGGERLRRAFSHPAINSLAVLPFAFPSRDTAMEDWSRALSEALSNNLAQLPQVRVIDDRSTRRFPPDADPAAFGRRLQVSAVVTGQVARSGDVISVSVQLMETSTRRQIWGNRYQRSGSSPAGMENDIGQEIAGELRVSITSAERQALAHPQTQNAEAYREYFKGRYFWNKRTDEGFQKAIEHFQRAIDLDPAYAPAYVGLGECWMWLSLHPPKERFPRALAYVRRALELDPNLAMAHAAAGYIDVQYGWNWAEADRELKRAIELNANYASAYSYYGRYLTAMGRFDEGLRQARRAMELDPLSPAIRAGVAVVYHCARQFGRAVEHQVKLLAEEPNYEQGKVVLAMAYIQLGRFSEAAALLQPLAGKGFTEASVQLGCAHARAGHTKEARAELAGIIAKSLRAYVSPYYVANLLTALGDRTQALDWLEKAYELRAPNLAMLKVQPEFDDLRSEPRFLRLLRGLGLAAA